MQDIDRLGITLKDIDNSLDRFEFELLMEIVQRNENGINFEFISPLIYRMISKKKQLLKVLENAEGDFESALFDSKNISVIQLGNVNKEIKEIIPSLISNMIYDIKVENKGDTEVDSIINIVIDEAHNLLATNKEQTELYGNSLKVFKKIIKEGRKFAMSSV